MTVLGLTWTLVRGTLSGWFRPGDVVVREFEASYDGGFGIFKEILFVGRAVKLREHPDPEVEMGVPEADRGINHTMFSRKGDLPERRVLKLD